MASRTDTIKGMAVVIIFLDVKYPFHDSQAAQDLRDAIAACKPIVIIIPEGRGPLGSVFDHYEHPFSVIDLNRVSVAIGRQRTWAFCARLGVDLANPATHVDGHFHEPTS